MPITPFLNGEHFDADTKRVMGVAFELARAALRVSDSAHPVLPHVANKIIELAKTGERNPDLLCERAMTDLGHRQISVGLLAKAHPARAVSDEQASAALTAHAAERLERAAALESEAAHAVQFQPAPEQQPAAQQQQQIQEDE
jgi:hypothetical protein